MKDLAEKAGLSHVLHIASAGTSDEELGNPVYPPARRKLLEHGIDPAGKTARQLQRDDYRRYDLIIGMERSNLRAMERLFGGQAAPSAGLYRPARRRGRPLVYPGF